MKAAAAIAADASAEEQAIAVREAEKLAVEDAAPAAAAVEEGDEAQKPSRGRQAKGGSKRQASDSKADAADTAPEAQQVLEPVAGGDESQTPSLGPQAKGASKHQVSGRKADAEDPAAESAEDPEPSPGPPRAQRAGKRIAKSATATPAQSKQPAASAPRTSRRMAAAGRYASSRPHCILQKACHAVHTTLIIELQSLESKAQRKELLHELHAPHAELVHQTDGQPQSIDSHAMHGVSNDPLEVPLWEQNTRMRRPG